MTVDAVLPVLIAAVLLAFGIWLGVRGERARHQIDGLITDDDRTEAVNEAADQAITGDDSDRGLR